MKEVLVTIKATINEPEYNYFKEQGYSEEQLLAMIKNGFNSAKVVNRFIEDFEVDSVEVKE